jgi:hypothetical protein
MSIGLAACDSFHERHTRMPETAEGPVGRPQDPFLFDVRPMPGSPEAIAAAAAPDSQAADSPIAALLSAVIADPDQSADADTAPAIAAVDEPTSDESMTDESTTGESTTGESTAGGSTTAESTGQQPSGQPAAEPSTIAGSATTGASGHEMPAADAPFAGEAIQIEAAVPATAAGEGPKPALEAHAVAVAMLMGVARDRIADAARRSREASPILSATDAAAEPAAPAPGVAETDHSGETGTGATMLAVIEPAAAAIQDPGLDPDQDPGATPALGVAAVPAVATAEAAPAILAVAETPVAEIAVAETAVVETDGPEVSAPDAQADAPAQSAGADVAPAVIAPDFAAVAEAEAADPADPAATTEGDLTGMTDGEVQTLLGPPLSVRRDAPAEAWQYATRDCVLDLFFYQETGRWRVAHMEARTIAALDAPANACVKSVLAIRMVASGQS